MLSQMICYLLSYLTQSVILLQSSSELLQGRCEWASLLLGHGKSGLGHDSSCTIKLDKNTLFTQV